MPENHLPKKIIGVFDLTSSCACWHYLSVPTPPHRRAYCLLRGQKRLAGTVASLGGGGGWAKWRGWHQRRVSALSGMLALLLLSPRSFSTSIVQGCLVFSPGFLMGLGADCLVQLSSVAKGSLPVPVCLEQNGSSNTAVHPCEIA